MPVRPTLGSWLLPESIPWSMLHVREMLPTARIRRASTPRALPDDLQPGLLGLEFATPRGTRTLGPWLEATDADSVTVLHRGRIALEWRTPRMRVDDTHLLFSVTKSVTGLLAGVLAGQGLLDPDSPVTRYVPEVGGSGFDGASVRHLLDMTAAFAFTEDYDPGDDVREYRIAAGWAPRPIGAPTLRGFLATRAPDGEHGQRFRYLSPATDLLGWVCERAGAAPVPSLLEQLLWQPLGAESDADLVLDPDGLARSAGGLCATPRDLARVGLLVAEGGAGIVPEWWVDDLTQSGSAQQWADGDFAPWLPAGAYRSCWYQPRLDPGAVMGVGIHGQMLYVDRVRGVVVARQSSWSFADDTDAHDDAYLSCQAIARALG